MKKLLLAFAVLLVAGCGKLDQMGSHYTGRPSEVCVGGVTYLQFTSGAAVAVDRDGKPVPCRR